MNGRQFGIIVVPIMAGIFLAGMLYWGASTRAIEAQSGVATSTRLSISSATVPVGGIASLEIHADILPTGTTSPSGLSGLTILVAPMSPEVAVVVGFDVPNYGISRADTVGVVDGMGAMRLTFVDLNRIVEPGMTDVLLATVKIEGKEPGVTAIGVSVLEVADDFGQPFQMSGTIGTVTVSASRDLDGDGLTEDCNGNGIFDFNDIVCWFELKIAP